MDKELSRRLEEEGISVGDRELTDEELREAFQSQSSQDEVRAELTRIIDQGRYDFLIAMAESRAAAGKLQSAAQLYGAHVRQTQDIKALCELGHDFLQQANAHPLPPQETDFSGFWDLDALGTLHLAGGDPPHRVTEPGLLHREDALRLGLTAYGQAWLRCRELWTRWMEARVGDEVYPPPLEDRFREILALDGMRAVFVELEDYEAFASLKDEYLTCFGDWPEELRSLISATDTNFSESTGFFRAFVQIGSRQNTADSAGEWLARRQQFKEAIGELARQLAKSGAPSQAEKLLVRFWSLVEEVSTIDPRETRKAAEERAVSSARSVWTRLPADVQRLLIDAEWLRPLLARSGSDWFPVAIAYGRCIELLLRECAPTFHNLQPRGKGQHDWRHILV